MFCIKCGKTLEPNARVCPDCGTKVVLPEGFASESETVVSIDVDMLTGEKTVAADHEAIARKAAAASVQPAEPVANAPVFQAPPPIAMPEEPKFSTGFDLNSAKKIMNGRSILIDDSPAPAAMPVFNTAPAPVQNNGNQNNPNNKKYTVIIIAAVAVIAVALGAIFFVLFSKNNEKDGDKKTNVRSEKTTVETTVEETFPLINDVTEEYSTKEYFEENTTLGNIAQDMPTEPSAKPNRPLFPSDKPDNGGKGDKEANEVTEAKTDIITEPTEKQEENEFVPTEPSTGIGVPNEAPQPVIIPNIPDILIS